MREARRPEKRNKYSLFGERSYRGNSSRRRQYRKPFAVVVQELPVAVE